MSWIPSGSKGATLSDKTARKEFGLRYDAIVRAIRAGRLHFRENSVYRNPFLRPLRRGWRRWSRLNTTTST
jgi:hypothetical protein